MENVFMTIGGWRIFVAGFSTLSFLSFLQWALNRASINAVWFHKSPTVITTQQIYRQMQLRYLSTALKVFTHFPVCVFQYSLYGPFSSCVFFSFQEKKMQTECFPSECLNLFSGHNMPVCMMETLIWRPKCCKKEAAGQDGCLLWY